jgi:hypothetical protein
VAAHEAQHGGQADPVTVELGVGVHALERPEELAGVAHVEADAVVALEEGALAVHPQHAHLQARRLVDGCELPGVLQQLAQDHPEQVGVGVHHKVRRHGQIDMAALVLAGDLRAEAHRDRAQVAGLALHLATRHHGEAQEVVDEPRQAL